MVELKLPLQILKMRCCVPTSPFCWISMPIGAVRAECFLPYCMSLLKKIAARSR